jgi:arylsulfatase
LSALAFRNLLALAVVALAGCAREAPRPNLLLISVDTLRADRLSCYGGAADVGVALCGIAADGARFTWAFAAAPSTAPSVASLLTSQLPSDHGVTELARSRLAGEVETVAESLAAAGYATAAFVANPVLANGRGFEQGFAVYDDRMQRREINRAALEREAAEITDAALAWLRVARAPWFLWLHYQDPHGPYDPPGAPAARDAPDAAALPLLRDQSGWGGIPAYQQIPGARAAATYEARYLDEIRWLDRHVARLVAGADTGGRRTAIAVTADHGEAFGEDGFWLAHGHSLGLDQIRVPLLWRPVVPGEARVVATPVSTLDVAPTLLAAAGLPPAPGIAGELLPLGPAPAPPRAPILAEHRLRLAVIAGSRYYARDREPLAGPVPEPITGGAIPPLPPRSAALASDGRAAAYENGSPPDLEALLAPRAAARRARDGPEREIDEQTRDALRALGYLE